MLEILIKSSKTGHRFTAISDLQTMPSVFYFMLGMGNCVKSFQRKFIVPRYRPHSCLKGKGYSCFFVSNS